MNFKEQFDLSNKVAITTGAAGVLGSKFCSSLANFGAKVIITDINYDKCERLADEIWRTYKVEADPVKIDLSNETEIVSFSKRILKKYKKIDILINNAAIKAPGFFKPFHSYKLKTWQQVMDVNVTSIFLMAREIGTSMAMNKSGSIINLSSIYGIGGADQRIYPKDDIDNEGFQINTPMVYAASKGAIVSMTKYMATYWGASGVRSNCIIPGGVITSQSKAFVNNYSMKVPMGRMAKADELIGALIFLSSDASSYVNGQSIIVDGGFTSW